MVLTETYVLARGSQSVIRQFNRKDVDRWMDWPIHSDPLYTASYPHQMNRYERDLWCSERTNRQDYIMFAVDDFSGYLVGFITIRNIDRQRIHGVLGITLRPEALSQGFGTDCLWTFLSYYFNFLNFDVMILDVAAYNRRAQRVYEKCGFVYTNEHWGYYDDYTVFTNPHYADLRPYFRMHGNWIETLYYDMVLRRHDYFVRCQLGLTPISRAR